MTFSDVFLPVPLLASPFDLHRILASSLHLAPSPPHLGSAQWGVWLATERQRQVRAQCWTFSESSCCVRGLVGHMYKGGSGKGGIRICLPVHCLSARTGNRTVTQMRHPFLVEGRPNRARQSLASTLSAPRVKVISYCHPGRHANVVTPCLL